MSGENLQGDLLASELRYLFGVNTFVLNEPFICRCEELLKRLQRIKTNFPNSDFDALEGISQDEVMRLKMEMANKELEWKEEKRALQGQVNELRWAAHLLCAQ